MAETTFNCHIGGRVWPMKVNIDNDKLVIIFDYFKPLVDTVKVMAGAEWHNDLKLWTAKNCNRNWFTIDKLIRGPRYSRYLTEVRNRAPDTDIPFWAHQQVMYEFMHERHRCLIGAEPRTGKTRPTLQVFYESIFNHCWWVATLSAVTGLELELRKWFKATMIGDRTYDMCGKIVNLLTYDAFTDLVKHLPAGTKLPGFVVFDECHKLKTIGSARSEAADTISEALENMYKGDEYVIGLSGTPAPLCVTDWWHQCEVVRPGFIREGSLTKFKVRYGIYKEFDDTTPAWDRFEGWNTAEVAQLSGRLAGLVKIFFQKDCMDLPPIIYDRVRIPPPKSLIRVAKMIAETSESALQARKRLRQLSDGFEYINEYDPDDNKVKRTGMEVVGSPKLKQLEEDLEEYEPVGRMVIYAAFTGSVELVRDVCLKTGWHVLSITGAGRILYSPNGESTSDHERILMALEQMDRSANDGKIDKLAAVCDPQAGGSGLEFSASPVIIYYSNSDSGEGKMQSKRRAYSNNMDKVRGLTIKDYILLPTDELILDKLDNKEEMQAISMGDLAKCLDNINID